MSWKREIKCDTEIEFFKDKSDTLRPTPAEQPASTPAALLIVHPLRQLILVGEHILYIAEDVLIVPPLSCAVASEDTASQGVCDPRTLSHELSPTASEDTASQGVCSSLLLLGERERATEREREGGREGENERGRERGRKRCPCGRM
jgi:hypothetical protein